MNIYDIPITFDDELRRAAFHLLMQCEVAEVAGDLPCEIDGMYRLRQAISASVMNEWLWKVRAVERLGKPWNKMTREERDQ